MFYLELEFLEYFLQIIRNVFPPHVFVLSSVPRVWQRGDTEDVGGMLRSSAPLHAAPAAPFSQGSAEHFHSPRLIIQLDWGVFPQCHVLETQQVLPVLPSTPSRGFCLRPQSQRWATAPAPNRPPEPAGHLTTFRWEDLKPTKVRKISERQKTPRGAGTQQPPGPAQRAFLHPDGILWGSSWANPSSPPPQPSASGSFCCS